MTPWGNWNFELPPALLAEPFSRRGELYLPKKKSAEQGGMGRLPRTDYSQVERFQLKLDFSSPGPK